MYIKYIINVIYIYYIIIKLYIDNLIMISVYECLVYLYFIIGIPTPRRLTYII